MNRDGKPDPETRRLGEDARRAENWKRWGPYLSEGQWATVREDYAADGRLWEYFPHDHARSRAYRWGEDGLLGICDREGRLCFALALWNERDPILNRARRILWLVTGREKAGPLVRLREADPSIPAGRVHQDRALVLADRAAASGLGSS
jgi:hypothetical protein